MMCMCCVYQQMVAFGDRTKSSGITKVARLCRVLGIVSERSVLVSIQAGRGSVAQN